MVVACIALLVALGGTGYAALRLPKNSVGTKQLRNGAVTGKKLAKGAVTGSKVAPDSLTGAQIKESSLGTVPSASTAAAAATAATAATATTAQNIAAPEAFHLVSAAGQPAFENSWQNSGNSVDEPAGFFKDREGIVHLQGRLVYHDSGNQNNVIFQLPPGYRPANGKGLFVPAACECTGTQTTTITIDGSGIGPTLDGSVSISNGTLPLGDSLMLDGITFRAGS
jgi:hypothetical protein